MNNYIKNDIKNAITQMRVAIMNTLADIETGERESFDFEAPIPLQLILQCAEERGWIEDMDDDFDWINGWEIDYWYRIIFPSKNIHLDIDGSLLVGNTKLKVNHDDE